MKGMLNQFCKYFLDIVIVNEMLEVLTKKKIFATILAVLLLVLVQLDYFT